MLRFKSLKPVRCRLGDAKRQVCCQALGFDGVEMLNNPN